MHMTFFDSSLDDAPIVIKDILDRILFVIPTNLWKRDEIDVLSRFLHNEGLLEFGANAFQGSNLVGTTEF